jgi:uncharacterized membrane protein YcaP (DUF421 family)
MQSIAELGAAVNQGLRQINQMEPFQVLVVLVIVGVAAHAVIIAQVVRLVKELVAKRRGQ